MLLIGKDNFNELPAYFYSACYLYSAPLSVQNF